MDVEQEQVVAERTTALALLAVALDRVQAVGVDPVDAADARALVDTVERSARRLHACQIALLDRIENRGLHRADGHRSAKVLVRHAAKLSDPEAARRARAAKALRDLPIVAAGHAAGDIGTCQIDRIARAHANPRIRARLIRQDDALALLASTRPYLEFHATLTDWERRTDEDGTRDTTGRRHDNRSATITQDFDKGWTIAGGCGSVDGAILHQILDAYTQAEWETDWAAAREQHGPLATHDHLARTDPQRRFDALKRIFLDATARRNTGDPDQPGRSPAAITIDLVIDETTFHHHLDLLARHHAIGLRPNQPDEDIPLHPATPAPDLPDQPDQPDESDADTAVDPGAETEPDPIKVEVPDDLVPTPGPEPPTKPDRYRCSTLDGHPLDPTEVTLHALHHHIRRVVMGADHVVIDLGRRRRLFTGPAHLAAQLTATHCIWPGCHTPTTHCQIDHLTPWTPTPPKDNPGDQPADAIDARGPPDPTDPPEAHPDPDTTDLGGRTDQTNAAPLCPRHNRFKTHGFTIERHPDGTLHPYRPDGTEIT